MNEPVILNGQSHSDLRGTLYYNNFFDLKEIRRFYLIENSAVKPFRGWQGHKVEQKWFQAIRGSFLIKVVRPDNWEKPSSNLKVEEYVLSEVNQNVLHLPGGFATGILSMEPDSKLAVFSDMILGESLEDDFRFDPESWL